jgi:hypothetical protein
MQKQLPVSIYGERRIVRDYFEEMKPRLNAERIPYVDILSKMRAHPEVRFYPNAGEAHMNAAGYAFTARAILPIADQLLLGRNTENIERAPTHVKQSSGFRAIR